MPTALLQQAAAAGQRLLLQAAAPLAAPAAEAPAGAAPGPEAGSALASNSTDAGYQVRLGNAKGIGSTVADACAQVACAFLAPCDPSGARSSVSAGVIWHVGVRQPYGAHLLQHGHLWREPHHRVS